jgi:DNA polymerase V
LKTIYKPGFLYKKAGVWLTELTDNTHYQGDLFNDRCEKAANKTKELLTVFDDINERFGRHAVHLGSLGLDKTWDTQFKFKSPAYTTRWAELPQIHNGT